MASEVINNQYSDTTLASPRQLPGYIGYEVMAVPKSYKLMCWPTHTSSFGGIDKVVYFINFTMSDKTLVIIGTGPGIGRSVACIFAAKRYLRVGLIARRPESLETEKLALEKAVKGVVVKTYVVDVADRDALTGAMDKVRGDLGQPECIFYNAARVTQTEALGCPLDEIEYDFKV